MEFSFKRLLILAVTATAFLGLSQAIAEEAASESSQADQDEEIEEIVVTGRFIGETGRSALKSDVPLHDVPITVSSYTDEFMKAIETTKLSDLYDYMTGVQRAGNTAYDITIRGFASGGADRNTLMVDGLPGLAVRFGSPPTINAERVEVVKGPASVLYGQVQPGGFVNMVTKKPQAEAATNLRFRTQTYYGDQSDAGDALGYTLSLDSTGALGSDDTWLYRVIMQYGDNAGFRDFGNDEDIFIVPSITWNPSADTSITAFVEHRNETVSWDDGLVAPNNAAGAPDIGLVSQDITTTYQEPGAKNDEKGTTYGVSFSHNLRPSLELRGNYRGVDHEDQRTATDIRGTRTCHSASVAGQLDPTEVCVLRRQRDQLNVRTYYFGDLGLVWDLSFTNMEHKILVGANWGEEVADFRRIDFAANNDTYDISLYNPVYGQATPNAPRAGAWAVTTYESLAVYVQDQISLGEKWKVLLGGRYEDFDIVAGSARDPSDRNWRASQTTQGSAFVPMAGLLFQPNDSMTYYVSYSESFNPPRPGRLDINGDIFEDPEEGVQVEIGLKADFMDGRSSVTLAAFNLEKRNSLQQIGRTGVYQLTGSEESQGFEFETNYSVTERWQILAGYSKIDAKVKDDVNTLIIGQQLRNSPEHTASMWNRIQLNDAFSMGLGVSYISDRFGTTPNSGGDARRLDLPGYTLIDLAFYYNDDARGLNATLKFGNLLDEQYYPSGFTAVRINPGAPSNVTFSITKMF